MEALMNKPLKEVVCPHCNLLTAKALGHCIHCGQSLKKATRVPDKDKFSIIRRRAVKGDVQ